MGLIKRIISIYFNYIYILRNRYFMLFLPYQNRMQIKSIACNHPNPAIRKRAFELLGAVIGEGTHINPGVRIVNDYPNDNLLIIGENVAIAPSVIFVCNSGPSHSKLRFSNQYVIDNLIKTERIIIENDVWIGAGVIILPGVKIGRGAIIGAGAVVISNIPEYTIATGLPAKPMKSIKEYNT